jgi:hypothetical protein
MVQTGRVDRVALEKLGPELARELGIAGVSCRVIPPFARDREQVAFIRSVLGALRATLPAVLDFADGPRSAAGLGLTLAHGLAALRPDVPLAEITMDRSRSLAVHPRSLLHAIEIQELWKGVAHGGGHAALVEHMRNDPRLQALAAPYQRFIRALEFGNPAEAVRAAKTVQQRLESLEGGNEREDWVAAIQPCVQSMTAPLTQEQPWSRRQLLMAEMTEKRGMHFLTALHLREALISALLEAYGQNAARGWSATTPGEGQHSDSRIRPRDVMAFVLGDPRSTKIVPDLAQVWQWVGSPRSRFVMTSPVAVDPALLREGNQVLGKLPALTRAILEENRLNVIVEALPYEKAIEAAISSNAVRLAPVRGRRRRAGAAETEDHGPQAGEEGAPAEGGEQTQGDARPPRTGDGPPPEGFRQRRDRNRPRRPDRPRPADRPREPMAPREVQVRGPRPGGPIDAPRPPAVPVGGIRRVERASQGLGNLGLALKNAGLNPTPRGNKDRPRREPGPPGSPPAESAAEASAEATPQPSSTQPDTPAPEPEPRPTTPDFDVAGPASTESGT